MRALAFDLVPTTTPAGRSPTTWSSSSRTPATTWPPASSSSGLLLPTLARAGRADTAYALLLQDTEPSWLTMVDRGATTVWERWNGVDAHGVAHESLNHYSKGAVVSFLHRYVAGLVPTSPGYRTFRVQPTPGGGLTYADPGSTAPYGPIVVAWRLVDDAAGLRLDLEVPPGTTAEVCLPDGTTATVGPGTHAWPGGGAACTG